MQAGPSRRSAEGALRRPNVDEPNTDASKIPKVDKPNVDERLLLRISEDVGRDWKQLATKLGFRIAENDGFEAGNRNNLVGQCHAMLVAWRRKQDTEEEARQGLIDALQETERMDLVRLLGESPDILAQAAIDRCQEELKRRYTTTGCYVQMLPWVDDDKRHIRDIYTKLDLVKGKNDSIQGGVKSYGDMFGIKTIDGDLVKRVICEGQAGMGKTTLLDKIAYDWATGNNEVLKQFKLVFVLKFSALSQDSDLVEAIFDQLLDNDTHADQSHVKNFIRYNPDEVVVLMDGFDEFMTTDIKANETFGTVLQLLNRKIGRECFVIVTTRPSHRARLTSSTLIQQSFALVNVRGFTQENVRKYVNRFYVKEKSKARGLSGRINSSSLLHELAKSPMLLLLMCLLWDESSVLPETMSRLYLEGIKYIFRRKGPDMLVHVTDTIINLGKVAFSGLTSPVQRLSFNETEFDKGVLGIAIKAGILTRQMVRKGLDVHNSIQFIHKTFQEYCAAKYCQDLLKKDSQIFRGTFANCNLENLEYLLRFCCGDNVDCTNAVLELLVENEMDKDKNMQLGLACFYESQADALPPKAFLNVVFQPHVTLHKYGIDGMKSFLYLLRIVGDQNNDMVCRVKKFFCHNRGASTQVEVDKLMRGMPNLTKFALYNNRNISSKGAPWSQLKEMKHLQKLILNCCSLKGNDLEAMAVPLSSMPNLTELDLSDNRNLGGKGAFWSPLKEMKHLQKLTLNDCSLTGDDLKAMAVPNLTELDLSNNKDLGGKGTPWSRLKEMKRIQKLTLYNCSMTGDDLKAMAVPLSSMPNLTELDLSININLGGNGAPWSQLKEMKHLQKLTLKRCSLTGDNLKAMAVPNLTELDLSENNDLGGKGTPWSRLKEMKRIQKLTLYECSMTGDDLKAMAVPLSSMPNLTELNLSSNRNLGGKGIPWSQLKEIKRIQKLTLCNCSLTGDNLKAMAVPLSSMPNLTELDLSDNRNLGGKGTPWSQLKEIKHLQKLNLSACSITGDDWKGTAAPLSSMPNLTELDLSINHNLGGNGAPWSQLKEMKRLQKLDLSYCSLTDDDLKAMAVPLSGMLKLNELDLSGNKNLGCIGAPWSQLKEMKHLQIRS